MSGTPTAEELTRALTGLLDAHRKYDAGLASAERQGLYSWDYGGHYADDVAKAHETLATTLNAYIDSRVNRALVSRDIICRNTLTLAQEKK